MRLNSIRSSWLDVLKALAMLGVILVHFNNAWESPIPLLSKISAIGARCPQMFFIISAYLTWSYLSRHEVDWKQFYKKRLIRIAPIFYTALIISALVPVLKSVSIGNWISHAIFLNGLIPIYTNSIMGVEWYIADLALFYILCPLLWRLVRGIRHSLIAFAISALLSSSSLIVYNALGGSESLSTQMYFETFFILHQLPVMMLGIVLYYLIQMVLNAEKKTVWKVLVESGAVVSVIGAAFIILHLNKRFMTSSLIAGLAWAWFFLVIWSVRRLFEKTGWKLLTFIGIHSFGIYCFHQIVINCVLKYVLQSGAMTWFGSLILVMAVSILIGYGAERLQARLIKA